jgi:hypothetical protein
MIQGKYQQIALKSGLDYSLAYFLHKILSLFFSWKWGVKDIKKRKREMFEHVIILTCF